jgi:pimeloyl-ACP methyl ester carboxylesterase
MGERLDINGHPTWVDRRGRGGDTVVLLHGGLSNSDAMLDLIGLDLGAHYRLVAFDRRGHGYTADSDAAFHYDEMATETIGVLERVIGGPAHLVGWSDGGIVSMLVALRRPDLVDRMVLIGANFHYNGLAPVEIGPDSPFLAMIRAAYAERSPDGVDHFGVVAAKSMTMFASEPTLTVDDLAAITAPTLVLVGDDDLIKLSHTCELYEALPNGQLAVVPGTSHALPMERPAETARIIHDFLVSEVPPATMMPGRRPAPKPEGQSAG